MKAQIVDSICAFCFLSNQQISDIKKHRHIGGAKKFDRQVKINTGSICFVSLRNKTGRNLPNSKYEFANTTSQQEVN
jgi:predicted secreted acid phosphatase